MDELGQLRKQLEGLQARLEGKRAAEELRLKRLERGLGVVRIRQLKILSVLKRWLAKDKE